MAAANLNTRRMVVGGLFGVFAGLPEAADAARSGGRVGGGSFRPKAAPRASGRAPTPPVINRPSVTVIQSAPSMPFGYGGYGGYGGGMFGTVPHLRFDIPLCLHSCRQPSLGVNEHRVNGCVCVCA